jgi:hypothetical protein
MILNTFPVGCLAGYPSYLIREGYGRVALIEGDPLVFSTARALLHSENSATAGVMAWGESIDPQLALRVCRDWVRRWLLAGAHISMIPYLLVVHLEPLHSDPTCFRTAVHWVVLNAHLGLRKAIRPYVYTRDFERMREWQDALNILHGWARPVDNPSDLRFSRAGGSSAQKVIAAVRYGVDVLTLEQGSGYRAGGCAVQTVVDHMNRLNAWDQLFEGEKPRFGWAAIIGHGPNIKLQFESGITIPLCTSKRDRRFSSLPQGIRGRKEKDERDSFNAHNGERFFAQSSARRIRHMQEFFGAAWCDPHGDPAWRDDAEHTGVVRAVLEQVRPGGAMHGGSIGGNEVYPQRHLRECKKEQTPDLSI